MKKNNAHHEYKFAPIATEVLLTAILPVGLIAGFILHPVYTAIVVAIYVGAANYLGWRLKMVGRRKLLKGEAQKFTGVCFADGTPLTEKVVASVFGLYQRPLFLNSFEGPIALVHGIPSYRRGFFDGEKAITTEQMADLFPRGLGYWLISCHNGYHGNYARAGQMFLRPVCTMNRYPIAFDFDEKSNSAIVWSGKEIAIMEVIMIPMILYATPIVKYIVTAFAPLENLLHNGRGDRRNQDIKAKP